MHIANIKYYDISNGDGVRTSVFVSGCRNHCDGCFNKEAWDFNYGKEFTYDILINIQKSMEPEYISGLSILGGEPLDDNNKECVQYIIEECKNKYPKKSIWLYTGYLWENIVKDEFIKNKILQLCDVLVDGSFIKDKKDISLKFRGSSNQRIIDIQKSLKENEIILFYGGS